MGLPSAAVLSSRIAMEASSSMDCSSIQDADRDLEFGWIDRLVVFEKKNWKRSVREFDSDNINAIFRQENVKHGQARGSKM